MFIMEVFCIKKLLYIPVSPKPEEMSTSKTVGRAFVNRFRNKNPDYMIEEIDLYTHDIPEINHKLFNGRAEPVSGEEYDALSEEEKRQVDIINTLCEQFLSADVYVIAAPMWSVSFPSRLKRYVDCVVINNRTISITPEEVKGLLDDKERRMVYIQSSGGIYPKILSAKYNHGIEYFKDIFKFLGVKKFESILVQGVDKPEVGKEKAIDEAYEDMEKVIEKVSIV